MHKARQLSVATGKAQLERYHRSLVTSEVKTKAAPDECRHRTRRRRYSLVALPCLEFNGFSSWSLETWRRSPRRRKSSSVSPRAQAKLTAEARRNCGAGRLNNDRQTTQGEARSKPGHSGCNFRPLVECMSNHNHSNFCLSTIGVFLL